LHLLDCFSERQSGKPLYLRVTRTVPARRQDGKTASQAGQLLAWAQARIIALDVVALCGCAPTWRD
jgi:hypothetical protein